MVKVCEVCGDGSEGFAHLIAICIRCFSTHEHAYCMRNHVAGVFPEDWVCESCVAGAEPGRNEETKAVAIRDALDWFPRGKRTRDALDCVPRGKRTKPSRQLRSNTQKPVERGKVKFIAQEEVVRLDSGALKNKLLAACVQEIPSSTSGKSPARLKRLAEVYSSSPRKVENLVSSRNTKNDTPVTISETKEVASSSRQKLPFPSSITAYNILCGSISDQSDVELRKRGDVKRIVGLYGPYLPAKDATWKGGFRIVENGMKTDIFSGFQAQPPSKVGRRAYDLSKTLPPIVLLQMLPQEQALAEHFEQNCVDVRHIGLYFFPCEDNVESSRHRELIQRMEQKEAVMVGLVNGAELMIGSSKYLKMDVEKKEFLWGVFCLRKVCVERLSEEEVAMEIDMVGGQDVGTVDVVVRSRDRTEGPDQAGESRVMSASKLLQQLSGTLSGPNQDCPPWFSVKKERDPPPGFSVKKESDSPPGFSGKNGLSPDISVKKERDSPPGFSIKRKRDSPPGFSGKNGLSPDFSVKNGRDSPPGFSFKRKKDSSPGFSVAKTEECCGENMVMKTEPC